MRIVGSLPIGGLCGMCHWLSPHLTTLPARAVQVTAVPWLRPGGNSGVQDALCHEIEWHEGFRHSETADLEVAAAAESAD